MIAKEKEFVETQAKKGVDIKPQQPPVDTNQEESKQGANAIAAAGGE